MAALHRDRTSQRKNSAFVYSRGKRKEAVDENCFVHTECDEAIIPLGQMDYI